MLKLSHDGIAEDADLVSVWDRLAVEFNRNTWIADNAAWPARLESNWGGEDTACGEVVN